MSTLMSASTQTMLRTLVLSSLVLGSLTVATALAWEDPPLSDSCDIYAVRRDPRNPLKTQEWLTPAEAVVLDIPERGRVYVTWDAVNEDLYIAGHDLQLLRCAGNVYRIDVIPREDELP